MLNYDAIVTRRADHIIPGDIIDTRCGVADYAWKTVTRVRYIDRPAPLEGRVELTLDGRGISRSRESSASTEYRVIPAAQA